MSYRKLSTNVIYLYLKEYSIFTADGQTDIRVHGQTDTQSIHVASFPGFSSQIIGKA